MTGVIVTAVITGLYFGLLTSLALIVHRERLINRLDTLIHDLAAEVEELNAELEQALAIQPGRTCTELGHCATRLTSDHRSVR